MMMPTPESVGFDWRCWNYQEHTVVPQKRAIISKLFIWPHSVEQMQIEPETLPVYRPILA